MKGKTRLRRMLITSFLLLLSSALISAAARNVSGFAEWYAVTIYPLLQGSIGRLSSIFPFSVSEMLCMLLPIVLIADIAVSILRSSSSARIDKESAVSCTECDRSHKNRAVRSSSGSHPGLLYRCILGVSILVFLYVSCCGVNYYREPFVDRKAAAAAAFSEEDLIEFCEYASARLEESSDRSQGHDAGYPVGAALAKAAARSMTMLSESDTEAASFYNVSDLKGYYPQPKMLIALSRIFSAMGVSGIYSPFTIEANVNGEMPGLEMPFTACHELSHLRGFMNEGEANFIGWLACIGSDETSFNRSGWIMAWIYAGNALAKADSDKYYELRKKLPDDVIRELDDNSEFWSSRETRASEVQDKVNDTYLRSNGQKQGIRSYGQLTTLMLMWYSDVIMQ